MDTRWLSPFVRRLALREWMVLFVGLLLMAATLGWQNGLGRLDQSIYDFFLSFNDEQARDDIIIVAIDDYSLSQLGRWPWRRNIHADLLKRLNHANPRAIGLDVILSEAESSNRANHNEGDDAKLRAALKQNDRTVLPVVMSSVGHGLTANMPIPELAQAAHALGHIDLEHDSDGVVRSVFLREGQDNRWWPHFAAALLATGNREDMSATKFPQIEHPDGPDDWQRGDQIHIPFQGGIGHFQSVPYVSVLRGEVPDEFFTDKYVLVGATALGMADSYPTPVSGSSGAMPGIEINAHVLASLLNGKRIMIAPQWKNALFNIMPVLMVLLGYLLLSPRMSLLATGGWLVMTLIGSYIGLSMGVWLAPSAAIIVLILSYPLWSWRRLEAAITYLGQEFIRLDQEPHLLPEETSTVRFDDMADVLEQRITAMERAARRVRDLRQFVSDSLDSLPDATLITTVEGRVLLVNKHAADYYRTVGFDDVSGMCIYHLLLHLNTPQPLRQTINTPFEWAELLDIKYTETFADGISIQDHKGRDLLVKSGPCYSAANQLIGWIVNIIDISTIRAAERSRDETLRFLSHDMRAPQASILALLELQSEESSALPQQELFARIEKASRKTLGLADNFVQLARAESHEYRLEEVDFHDLLFDAADEIWSLAKSKHIVVQVEGADGDYPVHVDRTLMTRALTNLLSNAINYSPEHTNIVCTVWAEIRNDHLHVVCSIRDHGYGISPADQVKLFRRFQHVETPGRTRHDGVGLGLVFVKTVVERHQGAIECTSQIGEGTTFTLALPCCQPD